MEVKLGSFIMIKESSFYAVITNITKAGKNTYIDIQTPLSLVKGIDIRDLEDEVDAGVVYLLPPGHEKVVKLLYS